MYMFSLSSSARKISPGDVGGMFKVDECPRLARLEGLSLVLESLITVK